MIKKEFVLFFENQIPTVTAQQKRFSFKTKHTYEPKRLADTRKLFMQLLEKEKPEFKLVGPVRLEIEFHYATKEKKKLGKYKTTRPDLDNTVKLLQDCMTRTEFWDDDNQVVILHLVKKWDSEPYIKVRVTEVEDD